MTQANRRQAAGLFSFVVCGIFVLFNPAFGEAQKLEVGLEAGVPLTSYFDAGMTGFHDESDVYTSATRRYTLGPSIAFWLTDRVGIATGVLYHRLGYNEGEIFSNSENGEFGSTNLHVTGNSWDIPLTPEVRFGHKVRFYAGGGAVLRYVGPARATGEEIEGSLVSRTSTTTAISTAAPPQLNPRSYWGITGIAGVEFRAGFLHLAPEFRYTRWLNNLSAPQSTTPLQVTPNEAEILLRISN